MKLFLQKLYERIFKNPLSSWMGVFLILFATLGLILGKIGWDQFAFFIPTIIGFFYVKDTIFQV